ncbi:zinc finger protein 3 homolog [Sabethes cyaneus]|uniref:zinc finger protein 3 homolog n=1 Tax=Sabethes cyaneus TaxID=53552 RepID=UPI00237D79DE|nr:zinc finger protein 3 homolog [Sabethes cyaneus]
MPCIVPTCLRSEQNMISFPGDQTLATRWFDAIEIGCGYSMQIASTEPHPEICSLHFTFSNGTACSYEEPSRFIHSDENCIEISGCRLCLTFYPSKEMVAIGGTAGEKRVASLLAATGINFHESNFLQLICIQCIAQIEIFVRLQTNFTQSELGFQNLQQKCQNSVQFPTIKVEVKEELLIDQNLVVSPDTSDHECMPIVDHDHVSQNEQLLEELTDKVSSKSQTTNIKKVKKKTINLREKLERTCYICNTVQSDANQLMVHLIETHTSDTGYRCDECLLNFPLLNMYNRHLSRHNESQLPIKCNVCSMRYSSNYLAKLHENKAHGASHTVKRFENKLREKVCDICGKLMDIRRLKEHIQQVHQKESHPKCDICDKSFVTRGTFRRHMLTHVKPRPYSCDQCDETFRRLLDYRHHKSIVHDGINPHICSECSQEFKNYHQLYVHKQEIHQKNPKTVGQNQNFPGSGRYKQCVTCAICRMRFPKSSELIDHVQSVHKEEQYPMLKCPHCPKTFVSSMQLSNHKQIHSGKHDCPECGASHMTKKLLQYHMDIKHSNGRVYDCSDCSATFTSLRQLNLHEVLHTKGKQHQCEFCEKSFLRRFQLVIHTRIHTGEKPFECAGCLKRFGDDRTFCKHKKHCQPLLDKKMAESKGAEEADSSSQTSAKEFSPST